VSETAQHFRRRAVACWRAAKLARDPLRKREFEEMAQAWLRLADRADQDPRWRAQIIGDKQTESEP
jgi:hypothetical protein